MTAASRLVIFDVDGTLVDSQDDITAALAQAFAAVGRPAPERSAMLGIVGLSLDVAMVRLAPDVGDNVRARMVEAYKEAYIEMRSRSGAARSSPLYAGALAALEILNARDDILLGVATGKSARGLEKLMEAHDLHRFFVTRQVADHHPSKPHPSMILQAMADAGVSPDRTVMIGDTSFDMDMAAAAGVRGLGVSWGYHPVSALDRADRVIDDFAALVPALDAAWGVDA